MGEYDLIQSFSILIILISALVYYFGILWGHTQVDNYNKADCYFASIMFVIKYMLPACALILYLQTDFTPFQTLLKTNFISILNFLNKRHNFLWISSLLVLLTGQMFLLGFIHYLNKTYQHRPESETYKDPETILYLDAIKSKLEDKSAWSQEDKNRLGRRKTKMIEHLFLFIISNLTILIIYILYSVDKSLISFLLSTGIGFLTLTNIVFSLGHSEAYYPKAKVYLKGKEYPMEGNILKYGEYIRFLAGGKTRLLNRDDISYIEYI